jgi:MFS family permease
MMKQSRNFAYITFADLIARAAYQMGKTPLLPIFAAMLGASGVFLGFIVSVSTLTGMVLKPVIGIFSDRWGRRGWLIAGTVFFAAMPFLYRFVHTPEQLFLIRLVHGLATAIYGPVTLAYVAEQTPRRRAEKLGWFGMARSAGYVVGPAAAGWLLLTWDPVGVFTIIGLMSSLVFVPVLLLPESVSRVKKHHISLGKQVADGLKSGSRTPAVWLSGGLEATVFIAVYAVKAFLPIYALALGVNVALVGAFFAVQEAIQMVLKPWGGRLGDRLGYRWAIGLGMAVLGITLPLITLPRSGLGLIVLAAVIGLAQAFIFPSTVALVSTQLDKKHIGAGMGLIGTLKNAGKVAGPIIGGILIQWLDYAWTFRLMGLMLVLGAGLVWYWSQFSAKSKQEEIRASV